MDAREIPEDVRRLVDQLIDSVPHLETLLLLWQHRERSWSEEEAAARLYIKPESARTILADLERLRLLTQPIPGRYQYDVSQDRNEVMTRLTDTHRRHLVQLTELIHAKTSSRSVRDFARAFRFMDDD